MAYNETPTEGDIMVTMFIKFLKLIGYSYALMFMMVLGSLVMLNVLFWTLT